MRKVREAVSGDNVIADMVHGRANVENSAEGFEMMVNNWIDDGVENSVRPGLITVIQQKVQSIMASAYPLRAFSEAMTIWFGLVRSTSESSLSDFVVVNIASFIRR